MLGINIWRRMLGVDRATVIEEIDFDEEADCVVVHVRPRRSTKRRCGRCGVRAPGYDQGEGKRNWRTLDLGTLVCHLQADSPRVNCPEHGPTVAQVPWARHGAGHSRDFDDQLAWLVTQTAKSTVVDLMRVAWRTVGSVISRVVADGQAAHDPFDGLTRVGVDEISWAKGHRYLLVTWNHTVGFNGSPFHELRGRLRLVDWSGGEVAGVRPARASGRVAGDLGGPRPGAEDDRRLCPWAC